MTESTTRLRTALYPLIAVAAAVAAGAVAVHFWPPLPPISLPPASLTNLGPAWGTIVGRYLAAAGAMALARWVWHLWRLVRSLDAAPVPAAVFQQLDRVRRDGLITYWAMMLLFAPLFIFFLDYLLISDTTALWGYGVLLGGCLFTTLAQLLLKRALQMPAPPALPARELPPPPAELLAQLSGRYASARKLWLGLFVFSLVGIYLPVVRELPLNWLEVLFLFLAASGISKNFAQTGSGSPDALSHFAAARLETLEAMRTRAAILFAIQLSGLLTGLPGLTLTDLPGYALGFLIYLGVWFAAEYQQYRIYQPLGDYLPQG